MGGREIVNGEWGGKKKGGERGKEGRGKVSEDGLVWMGMKMESCVFFFVSVESPPAAAAAALLFPLFKSNRS